MNEARLLTELSGLPSRERNVIRLVFLDYALRSLYADWPQAAGDPSWSYGSKPANTPTTRT